MQPPSFGRFSFGSENRFSQQVTRLSQQPALGAQAGAQGAAQLLALGAQAGLHGAAQEAAFGAQAGLQGAAHDAAFGAHAGAHLAAGAQHDGSEPPKPNSPA